ncbi:MAG: AbrB/MazE/SpoVT family DNA-binding domain-containing protein [Elusimicrobiota bacterium]
MLSVRISPKYQVVIPQIIRESMGLHSGEMVQVIPYENRIELIPVRAMKSMRGFLRGINTAVRREKDRL